MSVITQLSAADSLFLAGDSQTTYNHTAGLMILDPTGVEKFDFKHYRKFAIQRFSHIPQFRWRLHEVGGGLDRPYWVEQDEFDPASHIRRAAAASPGDEQALSEIAALIFSRQLDRRKPLWELWFIEGLAGGRVAIMLKLHHCMMDGNGALRLLQILSDTEPFPSRRVIKHNIEQHEPGRAPTGMEEYFRTTMHLLRLPGHTTRSLLDLAVPAIRKQLSRRRKAPAAPKLTLHPRLNADIGQERSFAHIALPLNKIMTVRKRFGVTVNDVVLAVVGGAIRNYLEDLGELPRQSMRTAIPVSLREEGDTTLDNKVTNVPVTLGTNQKDPLKRLMAVHRESRKAKKQARTGARSATDIVQAWPPFMVGALAQSVSPEQAAQMMRANLIVSNVRGPQEALYMAGARLETMYPMSIITPGLACNITCISYNGKMAVGLMADPDLLPDADRITRGMHKELNTLARLTKPG